MQKYVQQLGGGQPLAPGAGAEGQILGLYLAQVRLACLGAMLAHLEKNPHHLADWLPACQAATDTAAILNKR